METPHPYTLTKDQLRNYHRLALENVIHIAGGMAQFVNILCHADPTLSRQTVYQWVSDGCYRGRISLRGALLVESLPHIFEGVTAKDLRPDKFVGKHQDKLLSGGSHE